MKKTHVQDKEILKGFCTLLGCRELLNSLVCGTPDLALSVLDQNGILQIKKKKKKHNFLSLKPNALKAFVYFSINANEFSAKS